MASGHSRRGFLGELLRGAARTVTEVGSALRVDADEIGDASGLGARHETLPAAPAERLASEAELRALCAEVGLASRADGAAALALPSLRLTPGGDGPSRLGGLPDLPPGFEWPTWEGGELAFLAQLRLDGLPASPLPRDGALLVFFALAAAPSGLRPEDAGACRVVHVPDGATERPDRAADLAELPVEPSAELMLPPEPAALELVWTELDEWGELRERLARAQGVELEEAAAEYHALHRLLGYPDVLAAGMELDAELVANGIDLNGDGYLDPRVAELEQQAPEWRLLFQLSSDERLGVALGYYERLFLWIRAADLAAGRFDGVRAFVR